MDLIEAFKTVAAISAFCLGLRMVTDKGMLLYWLRRPYERATGARRYALMPFIGCVQCLSSVWGSAVWVGLHGMPGAETWPYWLGCIVAATFPSALLWELYDYIRVTNEKILDD